MSSFMRSAFLHIFGSSSNKEIALRSSTSINLNLRENALLFIIESCTFSSPYLLWNLLRISANIPDSKVSTSSSSKVLTIFFNLHNFFRTEHYKLYTKNSQTNLEID